MAILVSFALTNCEKKTISGQYRHEYAVTTLGVTLAVEMSYDFRSDGTYTCDRTEDVSSILDKKTVTITRKGTYAITGNKLLLTQTSEVHSKADGGEETSTEIKHNTLTIEQNGDLIEGDVRLKRQ